MKCFVFPAPTPTVPPHQAAPTRSAWWAQSRTTRRPAAAGRCHTHTVFRLSPSRNFWKFHWQKMHGDACKSRPAAASSASCSASSVKTDCVIAGEMLSFWSTRVWLCDIQQQRTVGQSQDTEGAFQDPQGAEDAPALGKKEQGQVQHRQHAQVRAALHQAGQR